MADVAGSWGSAEIVYWLRRDRQGRGIIRHRQEDEGQKSAEEDTWTS